MASKKNVNIEENRIFCTLMCCMDGVSQSCLQYRLYLLQVAGFAIGFRFKLSNNGASSQDVSTWVQECMADGFLVLENGMLSLSVQEDEEEVDCVFFTYEERELFNDVMNLLKGLDRDELNLLCVVDMLMQSALRSEGINGMSDIRQEIEGMASRLCSAYSQENFVSALRVLNAIRRL